MKILLISIGTRGDVEPFLAICELLQEEGHEVICAFPEQFRNLTKALNVAFHGLNPAFLELIHSKDGEVVMGGGKSLIAKAFSFVRLAKKGMSVNKLMMQEQRQIIEVVQPDMILHHTKAVYPLYTAVAYKIPQKIISPVPYIIHPIKGYAHLGFKRKILGLNIESLSYRIANYGLISFLYNWSKTLDNEPKISRRALTNCLLTTPLIYTISPVLFSGTARKGSPVKVTGYHEKANSKHHKPSLALLDFLKAHNKILLITFGSMTNPWPERITRLFCSILVEQNIPAIINTANGGLLSLSDQKSDLIHFEENLDYHWILPKIHAFIHHGGSGTTHLGIKYGCATMIIPHIVDQFIWNQLIFEKGAGPKGPKISKLRNKELSLKIIDLWTNASYKEVTALLSKEMQEEDLSKRLVQILIE